MAGKECWAAGNASRGGTILVSASGGRRSGWRRRTKRQDGKDGRAFRTKEVLVAGRASWWWLRPKKKKPGANCYPRRQASTTTVHQYALRGGNNRRGSGGGLGCLTALGRTVSKRRRWPRPGRTFKIETSAGASQTGRHGKKNTASPLIRPR